jgi:hypothetical protein
MNVELNSIMLSFKLDHLVVRTQKTKSIDCSIVQARSDFTDKI